MVQMHRSGCWMVMQPHLIHGIITVQIAHRNLEFPIDCPVCKLNTPESDDEEEAPEAAQHQLQTLTPSDRTCSDVISAQLGSDAIGPSPCHAAACPVIAPLA